MFAGAHLQPVKTIPSLQISPDWVMQFSLLLLLPSRMSMQRAGRERAHVQSVAGSHFLKRCKEGERRHLIGRQISAVAEGSSGVNPFLCWRWKSATVALLIKAFFNPVSLRVPCSTIYFCRPFYFFHVHASNFWICHNFYMQLFVLSVSLSEMSIHFNNHQCQYNLQNPVHCIF